MARPRTLEQRILTALADAPMTRKQLAELADANASSVTKVLSRLTCEGAVHAVATVREGNTRNQYVYGRVA